MRGAFALMLRYRCDNGLWTSAGSANPLNAPTKGLPAPGSTKPLNTFCCAAGILIRCTSP